MPDPVLIRDARIIDGTGAPWFRGDVLLRDGRVAAMGAGLPAGGATVVEAGGRFLAPGFIDAHAHDDLIFLREPDRPEKARQGVTSVVVGNCSFSLYPKNPGSEEALRAHFAGLLGPTAAAETFRGVAQYRERLEAQGIAINLVSLVGHGALRLAVMGGARRTATAEEIAAMSALLETQLRDGAIGLSLGLVYPPSAFAEDAELLALAHTVARCGKVLTAHVRSYEAKLVEAIEEFLALLRASGARGLLSHLQAAGRPNWGSIPRALARLEQARAEGVDVSFDMYPYLAGSTSLLQLLPPAVLDGGIAALLPRLRDEAFLGELRRYVEGGEPDAAGAISKVVLIGWENVRISAVATEALKHLEGRSVAEAAALEGTEPFAMMVQLILRDEGQTGVVLFQLDENDLRAAFTHPLHMVGSDGLPRPGTRPHPRAFGTFPRVAGRLVRESGWFTLEDAVRRMTSVAAQRFGLDDRGLLRPGMAADLVMFDAAVTDHASFDDPTALPGGIVDVWVRGERILEGGAPTGARPGRLLAGGMAPDAEGPQTGRSGGAMP
ncbi:N-acyl-D-amino-acid deacylase family protein [Roseomonas elaeocarpi]|uniref:Amidohydrolase family protein n=1 Tax=Roseomonas elaeocarpi TaxID=907779 RepID=A0ABV6JNZ4_9PROT